MTKPLVTVGIPFYNAQATLADAIRSVFAQTLADWELILVDDGSTDGSLEIASSVADSRVRVVSDGRNLGLATRLNQIAQLAGGDYLARMDADDLMHRDRLALQVEYLHEYPSVDVVGTGMCILNADGAPAGKRLATTEPLTARRVLTRSPLMHATVVGRTDWFRRNPYERAFPPAYPLAEDFELWCRTFHQSHFASLPGCYYYCTEHTSFTIAKYATAARSVAKAQWVYGGVLLGHLHALALCIEQLAKIPTYAAARLVGGHSRLIAKRSVALSSSETEQVNAELGRIRATALPSHHGARASTNADSLRPSVAPEG